MHTMEQILKKSQTFFHTNACIQLYYTALTIEQLVYPKQNIQHTNKFENTEKEQKALMTHIQLYWRQLFWNVINVSFILTLSI